jgi:3-oxoacyl-[acyl-carrier-protein] synthase II
MAASPRPEALGPAVTIAGAGAVTGYGWGMDRLRQGLYAQKPACRLEGGFSPWFEEDLGWIARVEDGGDPEDGPSRFMRAVRAAAREAVADARQRGWQPGEVVGLVHGVTLGEVDLWRTYHHRQGLGTTRRQWLELMPSTVLMEVMREFDVHGPAMAVTAMCASGLAALLTARLWIATGQADDVLVISTDISSTPENCRSLANLAPAVLDRPSLESCLAFQEDTLGFGIGEASVAMLVTRTPLPGRGRLLGGAMSHDAFHPTAIPPGAPEVARCVRRALQDAGLAPEEVAYVNGYGNGNPRSDQVELAILDELLPAAEGIFSVKPLVGHCMSASAAVEVLASLLSFETGVIPAPPRLGRHGHPRLLDGLTAAVEAPVLKPSLGFGGHNAAVVLEACPN